MNLPQKWMALSGRPILDLCAASYLTPQRVGGREGCYEAICGVSLGRTAFSADLGGSSKYSKENFED